MLNELWFKWYYILNPLVFYHLWCNNVRNLDQIEKNEEVMLSLQGCDTGMCCAFS